MVTGLHVGRAGTVLVGVCVVVGLVLARSPLAGQAGEGQEVPPGAIQVQGDSAAWVAGPPTLPAGTEIMVLEGDPGAEGLFTMRIRAPGGARLEPHWHPQDERVTVFSGLVGVGFGDEFEESGMATFGPGSFYANPAGSHHYVWIVEETVMQITGVGPWEIRPLEGRW